MQSMWFPATDTVGKKIIADQKEARKHYKEAKQSYDQATKKKPAHPKDFLLPKKSLLAAIKLDVLADSVPKASYGEQSNQAVLKMLQDCEAKSESSLRTMQSDAKSTRAQADALFQAESFEAAYIHYDLLIVKDLKAEYRDIQHYYLQRARSLAAMALSGYKVSEQELSIAISTLDVVAWISASRNHLVSGGWILDPNITINFHKCKRDLYAISAMFGYKTEVNAFQMSEGMHRVMKRSACAEVSEDGEEKITQPLDKEFGETLWKMVKFMTQYGQDEALITEFRKLANRYNPDELATAIMSRIKFHTKAQESAETENDEIVLKQIVDSLKACNPDLLATQLYPVARKLLPAIAQTIVMGHAKYIYEDKNLKTIERAKELFVVFQETRSAFPAIKLSLYVLYYESGLFRECGLYDEALQVINEGIGTEEQYATDDPKSALLVRSYYGRGFIYHERGSQPHAVTKKDDYAAALADISHAIGLDDNFKVLIDSPRVLKLLGQCEAAQLSEQKAMTLNDLDKLRGEADLAFEEKRYEDAIKYYDASIKLVARDSARSITHYHQRGVARLELVDMSGKLDVATYVQIMSDLKKAIWIYHTRLDSEWKIVNYIDLVRKKASAAVRGIILEVVDPKKITEKLDEICAFYTVVYQNISAREAKVLRDELYELLRKTAQSYELSYKNKSEDQETSKDLLHIAISFYKRAIAELGYPRESVVNKIKELNSILSGEVATNKPKDIVSEAKQNENKKKKSTIQPKTYGSHVAHRRGPTQEDIKRFKELQQKLNNRVDPVLEAELKEQRENEAKEAAEKEARQRIQLQKEQEERERAQANKRLRPTAAAARRRAAEVEDKEKAGKSNVESKSNSSSKIDDIYAALSNARYVRNSENAPKSKGVKKHKLSEFEKRLRNASVDRKVELTDFEKKIMKAFGNIALFGGQSFDRTMEDELNLDVADLMRLDADEDFQTGLSLSEIETMAKAKFGDDFISCKVIPQKNLVRLKLKDNGKERIVDIRHNKNLAGPHPDYNAAIRECDVTISAIFVSPDGNLHADPRALDDLKNGIIRMVTQPEVSFDVDPLQILRVLNKVAMLQQEDIVKKLGKKFVLADEQENKAENIPPAIKQLAKRLNDIEPDRVNEKLRDLFFHANHEKSIRDLLDYGVLETLFPDCKDIFSDKDFYKKFCTFIAEAKSQNNYSLVTVYDYLLNEFKGDKQTIANNNRFFHRQYDYIENRFATDQMFILHEIGRASQVGLPLQKRSVDAMRANADKLSHHPDHHEINLWLTRIISGKNYQQAIDYLVTTGVTAQLFPPALSQALRDKGDVASALAKIVKILPVKDTGYRSLTDFYIQLDLILPGVVDTHPLFKAQFDFMKAKRVNDFVTELDKLHEEKASPEAVNEYLRKKSSWGNAEWLFTTLLEKNLLPKLFPKSYQTLVNEQDHLLGVMQRIDKHSNRNVLDSIYLNFAIYAAQGREDQVANIIAAEPLLKTYFDKQPYTQAALNQVLQGFKDAHPKTKQSQQRERKPHRNKLFTNNSHSSATHQPQQKVEYRRLGRKQAD